MSDGYTYTTISARPGERPRIGVAFYLDEHAWITVPGTDERQAAPAHRARRGVGVASARAAEAITAEDVVIARRLADQAAEYAAEIERLAASTSRPTSFGPTAA